MLLITLILFTVHPNVSCCVTSEHYFKIDFRVIPMNYGIMGVKSGTQNFSCRQLNCHNSTYPGSPKFVEFF